MSNNTIEQEIELQCNPALTAAIDAEQERNGGQLAVLSRYWQCKFQVGAHLAYWHQDEEGRFIVGENWHVKVRA